MKMKLNENHLQNIGHQLEIRHKYFLSRQNVFHRIFHEFIENINFIFELQIDRHFYRVYKAKKWINKCLQNYLELVKQLVNVKKARDDFTRIQTDVEADKDILLEKMKSIQKKLTELRNSYIHTKTKKGPVSTFHSDISLALANYERCNNLYILYNDILSIIDKTIVETERIEKLSSLCGVINNSSFIRETLVTNESFEDTLFELLGYVAKCDKTKDYITGQLSLAKSENVDMALQMGTTPENIYLKNVVDCFMESGDFAVLDSKSCRELTKHNMPTTARNYSKEKHAEKCNPLECPV